MSNLSITADKTPWYQWDTGLTVTVSGGEMTECHFANRKQGTAYVQAVIKGKAKVPDELLQVAAPITAYGYIPDGAGGQTYIEQVFEVTARNIPADYTYTKTAQKTIRDAEKARDQALAAVNHVHDVADQVVGFRDDAKASADAAKKSADSAEYQKGQAKQYADDAGVAFANAQGFAIQASSNATAAEWAKNHAKTSETNAAASASEAATSAQEAKTAAGNAASEVLAATKANADAAAQSATDAATAKAGAETAASNAATSASAAADSAAAAAKSAGDAAASVDAINVIAPKTVGVPAVSSDQFDIAIGQNAKTAANQSIAIGVTSDAAHLASIALGSFAKTSKDYELAIGNLAKNGADITREITHVSTPTAPTSASTKKYTDDNDAKTLAEAKKYTDDNTTNALIGTVSGKLLHVDDAWPGKPLGLTIDGAYKQDGTPSPESPVPITVIENPALKVTGRNLLDLSTLSLNTAINSDTGAYYELSSGNWYANREKLSFAFVAGLTLTMSVTDSSETTSVFFYDEDGVYISRVYFKAKVYSFAVPENTVYITFEMHKTIYTAGNACLAIGSENKAYRPYTSATLPITLPAEHPYLAALPDGTHDEIVIDKDGNASLVARVARSDMPNVASIASESNQLGEDGTVNRSIAFGPIAGARVANGGTGLCTRFPNAGDKKNRDTVRFGASNDFLYLYTSNEDIIGDSTKPSVDAWFVDHRTSVVYPLATPVTYPLGKLTIPSLPETISNVWTDAELTANMSMTYKQDVNTVIAGLIAQINALKGTANEPPEVTEPTIA